MFNEFRPLFRMLEEPFGNANAVFYPLTTRTFNRHPFFRDGSLFGENLRPSVDLSEQGNSYVVEAEIPGVTKENLAVRIGDSGRSVTIEGKVFSGRNHHPQEEGKPADSATPNVAESSSKAALSGEGTPAPIVEGEKPADDSTAVAAETSNGKAAEVALVLPEKQWTSSTSFSRTVWLPREVDESKVSAKLENGILTLRMPKMEDKEARRITIE